MIVHVHLRLLARVVVRMNRVVTLPAGTIIRVATILFRRSTATDCIEFEHHAVNVIESWLRRLPRTDMVKLDWSQRLTISGWVADPDRTRALKVKEVRLYSERGLEKVVSARRIRKDVEQHFEDQRLRRSGFRFVVEPKAAKSKIVLCTMVLSDKQEFDLPPEPSLSNQIKSQGLDLAYVSDHERRLALGFVDAIASTASFSLSNIPRNQRLYVAFVTTVVSARNRSVIGACAMMTDQRLLADLLSVLAQTGVQLDWSEMKALAALRDLAAQKRILNLMAKGGDAREAKTVCINRLQNTSLRKIIEATDVTVVTPSVHNQSFARAKALLTVPALGVFHLRNVEVVRGGTVVSDDEVLLYDLGCDSHYEFAAGTWDHLFTHSMNPETAILAASKTRTRRIQSGVLLTGRSAGNYFHCLIEYLPRLFLVLEDPVCKEVPIIIAEETPSSIEEALVALCPDREIIKISRNDSLLVQNLFLPSMHTFIPDSTRQPWIQGARLSPQLLTATRDALRKWASPLESQGNQIFLLRNRGARTLENAAQIEAIARDVNMQLVAPETLSIRQQIGMFSTATHVVGIGGAAMANTLFCRPGTKIMALVSEQLHDFVLHAAVAAHSGAELSLLLGKTRKPASHFDYRRDYLHAPFSVSAKSFRTALDSLLAR